MYANQSPSVAFTFDDGPGPSTEALLDVLAHHHVIATFFVLGRNLRGDALAGDVKRAQSIVTRTAREGHLLGNHTVSHRDGLSADELTNEVMTCDELLRASYQLAGRDPSVTIPIRMPFGPFRPGGAVALEALTKLGRPHCHWSADPLDWRPGRTATQIASTMLRQLEKAWQLGTTPVVLLHDAGQGAVGDEDSVGIVRDATVAAVDEVCGTIRARQVRYLTVLECPQPQVTLPAENRRKRDEYAAELARTPVLEATVGVNTEKRS
jgi:peptidoglycan/xylan/chitin deacetylase (PgdA/CDA1 family)